MRTIDDALMWIEILFHQSLILVRDSLLLITLVLGRERVADRLPSCYWIWYVVIMIIVFGRYWHGYINSFGEVNARRVRDRQWGIYDLRCVSQDLREDLIQFQACCGPNCFVL
jgi:hypothetical protein